MASMVATERHLWVSLRSKTKPFTSMPCYHPLASSAMNTVLERFQETSKQAEPNATSIAILHPLGLLDMISPSLQAPCTGKAKIECRISCFLTKIIGDRYYTLS